MEHSTTEEKKGGSGEGMWRLSRGRVYVCLSAGASEVCMRSSNCVVVSTNLQLIHCDIRTDFCTSYQHLLMRFIPVFS